ncbi:hypothetical protein CRG98_028716 [Punica granatum]|uniref:Uncharacterized protein n=1 Tax=Punica granatum TaxID=22663 RepID=A0A2I0J3S6_PUNGR|nr:hypothetical protein CRG98_028716 [Punica granatum]
MSAPNFSPLALDGQNRHFVTWAMESRRYLPLSLAPSGAVSTAPKAGFLSLTGSAHLSSIFAGPAQKIRPSPFGLVQSSRDDPIRFVSLETRPSHSLPQPSPPFRGPTAFRSLALLYGLAPAPGPARPRSRPAPRGPARPRFRPAPRALEPVLPVCSVQTASGPIQQP